MSGFVKFPIYWAQALRAGLAQPADVAVGADSGQSCTDNGGGADSGGGDGPPDKDSWKGRLFDGHAYICI